jgi:hypothetical protein
MSNGLRAALEQCGGSLSQWTVLSDPVDPFRQDIPSGHRDGQWLGEALGRKLGPDARIHNRGLHYILLGEIKPNGEKYVNDAANYEWLEKTSNYARWLGYIPFDRITDERNAAPVLRLWQPTQPTPYVSVDFDVQVPDAEDLEPYIWLDGFQGKQEFHLALIGEKSSLGDVLGSVAEKYQADLFLPTGCLSNTLIYQLARNAAADGRPLVVLYFADCDPGGHNMAVEVSRKLQAFKISHFPELQWECHRAGLTPDQVRQFDLPMSVIKETEKRGESWVAATGVEQTEIDALATLQPDLLRRIAEDAIAPFYDTTLASRVEVAKWQWREAAQAAVDEQAGAHLDQLRTNAADLLAQKRAEIKAILETVQIDASSFDLPPVPNVPPANIAWRDQPMPLCDSRWDFAEQCRSLKADKAYQNFNYGGGDQ